MLEYQVVNVKPKNFQSTCDEYARAGWRLVTVTTLIGTLLMTSDWYLFFESERDKNSN